MSRTIPVPSEPLLTRAGQINPIWWRYLRGLESQGDSSGVQAQIESILRRLAEIPEAREIIGRMSVTVTDQPDGTRAVQLDGDSLTPGSNAFYCTDPMGRRQWATLSQMIGASDGIVFTDSGYTVMGAVDSTDDLPSLGNAGEAWWVGNVLYAWSDTDSEWQPDYSPSGLIELSLANVTPEPGGTLQKTQFDAKGRRSHEGEATTDDLPEGAENLYYTPERASGDAPVQSVNGKTGAVSLSASDVGAATAAQGAKADSAVQGDDPRLTNSREWTAATVSQAEAEAGVATTRRAWTAQRVRQAIAAWWAGSAAKTMLDGLVVQSIADGDTTHAPSGDAVFDALEGKMDKGVIIYDVTPFQIIADTPAGDDSRRIAIASSGSVGTSRGAYIVLFGNQSATSPGDAQVVAGSSGDVVLTGGAIRAGNDNQRDLGRAAVRWREVFAVNGAINTSDAREKEVRGPLNSQEIACAIELASAAVIYQWKAAIADKGVEYARLHCSPTVQSVIAIMESHGLDPFRYGFVCYDEWDEKPEIRDEETGEVTQEYRPAGDRYSLRPTELAHFVMCGLASRQDQIEARLTALESGAD